MPQTIAVLDFGSQLTQVIARRAREQRQVIRPAFEATEAGVEAQATRIGIAVRGADETDARIALAGLCEEIFDEQQVVEFERQRGAAHGDDLAFESGRHGNRRIRFGNNVVNNAHGIICR